MALKVLNKINSRLRFLYKKHMFLSPPHLTYCFVTPTPFRLRFSSLVPQPYQKINFKIEIFQNKCVPSL